MTNKSHKLRSRTAPPLSRCRFGAGPPCRSIPPESPQTTGALTVAGPSYLKTEPTIIGKKVALLWHDTVIVGLVKALDKTYPNTAYSVIIGRQENPAFELPDDPYYSGWTNIATIAHCGQVLQVV